MSATVKIDGKEIALRWDNSTARQVRFRQSALGESIVSILRDIQKPAKAEAAMAKLLWAMLPDVSQYPTPESLWLSIADEDMVDAGKAVMAILAESSPSDQKKTSSGK